MADVKKIGVIGAGQMGNGIAHNVLQLPDRNSVTPFICAVFRTQGSHKFIVHQSQLFLAEQSTFRKGNSLWMANDVFFISCSFINIKAKFHGLIAERMPMREFAQSCLRILWLEGI